jgi:hypothetical protein
MSLFVTASDRPYVIMGNAVGCYENLEGDPVRKLKHSADWDLCGCDCDVEQHGADRRQSVVQEGSRGTVGIRDSN